MGQKSLGGLAPLDKSKLKAFCTERLLLQRRDRGPAFFISPKKNPPETKKKPPETQGLSNVRGKVLQSHAQGRILMKSQEGGKKSPDVESGEKVVVVHYFADQAVLPGTHLPDQVHLGFGRHRCQLH